MTFCGLMTDLGLIKASQLKKVPANSLQGLFSSFIRLT